jgi:hypothetical protein
MAQASLRSVAARLRATARRDWKLALSPGERGKRWQSLWNRTSRGGRAACGLLSGLYDRPHPSPLPRERGNPFGIGVAHKLRGKATLLLLFALTVCVAACKSNSPAQYISPRVEGRVVDGHSHAPIQGVHVQRVTGDDSQKVPVGQKGGQLMEGRPVVVTTGKDGSFILDSEHDLAFLRKLGWYSVDISFEHPAYERLVATYTLSNAVNTATGEPVVKAGDILLAPLSR